MKEVGGTCSACHKQYREQDAEGNYKIKAGHASADKRLCRGFGLMAQGSTLRVRSTMQPKVQPEP